MPMPRRIEGDKIAGDRKRWHMHGANKMRGCAGNEVMQKEEHVMLNQNPNQYQMMEKEHEVTSITSITSIRS